MNKEQQLQMALTTRLVSPNTITFKIDNTFEWDHSNNEVTYAEWFYVCWLVENSFDELELDKYVTALLDWAKEFATEQPSTRLTITQPWDQYLVKLTWHKRAITMRELGLIL
jgi:hypothetical protein